QRGAHGMSVEGLAGVDGIGGDGGDDGVGRGGGVVAGDDAAAFARIAARTAARCCPATTARSSTAARWFARAAARDREGEGLNGAGQAAGAALGVGGDRQLVAAGGEAEGGDLAGVVPADRERPLVLDPQLAVGIV